MAQLTLDHFIRLARLADHLPDRQSVYLELNQSIERQQAGGAVVEGERWVLSRLEEHRSDAVACLAKLAQARTKAEVEAHLAELESALLHPDWDVGQARLAELGEELARWQVRAQTAAATLADWRGRVAELRQSLEQAWLAKAPVVREQRALQRIMGLVDLADQTLREGQLPRLQAVLDRLAGEEETSTGLAAGLTEKQAAAQPFARQADLLLLRSPLVMGQIGGQRQPRYEYTVMLHTPSPAGARGINIQDSSTVGEEDRRLIFEIVQEVTAALNDGLLREFQLRGAAPSPADATREDAITEPTTSEPTGPQITDAVANGRENAAGAGQEETWLTGGEISGDENGDSEDADSENVDEREDIETTLRRLIPLSASGERIHRGSASELAEDAGDLLYRLLMPDQMQQYLNHTPCSVTITTNDLELPWELMYHDGSFLCLERPVARMPMGRAFPRTAARIVPERAQKRFLLIYADPRNDLPAAGDEIEHIRAALQAEWGDRIRIDVLSQREPERRPQSRLLNEILRRGLYDVIHYAGHAAFDEEEGDLSGLFLQERDIFFAQKIRRLLEGNPLVFLNACESGRTANERNPQAVGGYLQKPAEGLASAFIYGGARGCIGSLWPVYDRPAAEFAVHFYNYALEGYMIGEAMRRSRLDSRAAYPTQITWASFVLYGDPTYQLTAQFAPG